MPIGEEEKTIAFVLYPGLTVFDLAGPLQVLSTLSAIAPEYRTMVASERLEPVVTDIPGEMKVIPTNTFEEVPHPFALVVPGGATIKAMRDETIRSYVRTAAKTSEVVGSVCTGALILASVSLLEGRQATTHWAYQPLHWALPPAAGTPGRHLRPAAVGGGQQVHHLSGGVGRLVVSWRVWRRWRYSSGSISPRASRSARMSSAPGRGCWPGCRCWSGGPGR